jgi:transposase
MEGGIHLQPSQRETLLNVYHKTTDPPIRLRAHVPLLSAHGYARSPIAAMLYTGTHTIRRWKHRFEREGLDNVLETRRGRPLVFLYWWATLVGRWVTQKTPRDFGFLRSRWSCATVVLLLWEVHRVRVSAETVRRWLHREQIVWRRPRPVAVSSCVSF